jgi:hypothetical protein
MKVNAINQSLKETSYETVYSIKKGNMYNKSPPKNMSPGKELDKN